MFAYEHRHEETVAHGDFAHRDDENSSKEVEVISNCKHEKKNVRRRQAENDGSCIVQWSLLGVSITVMGFLDDLYIHQL